jgi:hypothetical protein
VTEAAPLEDLATGAGFLSPPSTAVEVRVEYYVEAGEGSVSHHEKAFMPNGEVLYDQAVPVHYAVGSGVRGRSYLTNHDGVLCMSPMSWYSGKGCWDFSPGYQMKNQHFERRIRDGCLTCHSGRMAAIKGLPDVYDAVQPFREPAIGCERCHGPGEAHVAYRRRGAAAEGDDPIVNPSALEPRKRDAVCFQCHLVGEERVPRFGRGEFDFRPGDDLLAIWTIFVRGTGVEDDQTTEAVSQVEQMVSSACYRKGAGRLGCISCHDPHAVPAEQERVGFYRRRCLECHASTDHRVLRSYDAVAETVQTEQPVLRIFGDDPGLLPEAERNRALGLMMAKSAEKSRELRVLAADAIALLEPWVTGVPEDESAAELLGAAYLVNEDRDAAYETWQRVLTLNPRNESVLSRLLEMCARHDRRDEGVEYARRLIELNPWDHDYYGRLAHLLGQRREYQPAIEAAERAAEIRPSDFWIRGWLAEVYRLTGEPERAAAEDAVRDLLMPKPRP